MPVQQLTAQDIIATIDAFEFAEIAERYSNSRSAKYLDLPKWIARNLRRVQALGLDAGPLRRVLDLGCGCGYFLYICKLLGHSVLGLDVPGTAMFRAITNLLDVRVVPEYVERFVELRSIGKRNFDLVTAHMVTFNGHRTDHVWGPEEWRFLLDDIGAPTVYLELNREPDGTLLTSELEDFFRGRGAIISGHRVLISPRDSGLDRPETERPSGASEPVSRSKPADAPRLRPDRTALSRSRPRTRRSKPKQPGSKF